MPGRKTWVAIGSLVTVATVFLTRIPAASAGDEKPDQEAPIGNSKEFKKALTEAHKKVVARDAVGAIDAYRAAIVIEPSNPAGHYFLGAAQLLKGDKNDVAEADVSWQTALRYAAKSEKWKARVLFATADLRERQDRLEDAKIAWETYRKFLEEHPQLRGYGATAIERRKVIDVHRELAKKYGDVKRRIEQRIKEASRPPASLWFRRRTSRISRITTRQSN